MVGDSGAGGAASGAGAGDAELISYDPSAVSGEAISTLACVQAQVMREAAKSGVPFCEKCTEPEKTCIQAQVLKEAAELGSPFCEKCGEEPRRKETPVKGKAATATATDKEKKTAIEPVTKYAAKPPASKKLKVVELVEVFTQGSIEKIQAAAGREQYINLDKSIDTSNPHPEYGRFIQLKARVKWDGDKIRSLAGESVYWKSHSNPANKTGLTGSEKDSFDSAGSGINKKAVKVDDQGWTPIVKFCLSQYGGDKFDIYATADTKYKGGLKAGTYTVWRKLWYEIDTMEKRGGGTLDMDHNKLPDVYKPCFIRLEKQGTDNQPNNKWNIETRDLHDFANGYFGAEKSPFQAHEVAIDHQADKKDEESVFELDRAVYTDSQSESYYVYDGGDTWLKSVEYNDGSGWKPLAKSKVSLTGTNKVYKKIKIDLSTGPVTPSPANKIKVKLKYIKSKEWSGDGGSKPHAIIAMGYWYDTETGTEAKKRTVGTMAHELGHLLAMVPSTSTTYINTGTGNHCSDSNCVMYSTNTTTRGNTFCSVCTELLRKADITNYKNSFRHTKGMKALMDNILKIIKYAF